VALVQFDPAAAAPVDVKRIDLRPIVNAALQEQIG
jgi:hypothetical protein